MFFSTKYILVKKHLKEQKPLPFQVFKINYS